jgi:Flp pilus assembly protein TadD
VIADNRRKVWLALGAGVLAAAVYPGSLGCGFTFDDQSIVVGNPLVRQADGLPRLVASHYWIAEARRSNLYRPLTVATYWLDFRLFGDSPRGYHFINLMVHGAVTSLLFLLFFRLSGSELASVVAAILFAVHPIHTEAVVNIAGRAELLAALFVLGAWLQRHRPWIAGPLFFCALASKENAIVLPVLLWIEDVRVHRSMADWRRRYAPFLAAILAFLALRFAVLGVDVLPSGGPFVRTPALERILTAVAVIGRYLRLLVWPVHLSADYSPAQIPLVTSPFDPAFLVGTCSLACCAAFAFLARRRAPSVTLGILFFFVALFPVSNLPFGIGVVMAERLLYLPSAGFCLAIGAGTEWLTAAFYTRRLVVVAVLAALTCQTLARIPVWRDQRTLFEATVRSSPQSALAHASLGAVEADAGHLDKAEAEYRRALTLDPESPLAHSGLASLVEAKGQIEQAIAHYGEAIRAQPDAWRPHDSLALLYESAGRLDEAEAEFRTSIDNVPIQPGPHSNLGLLLETRGRMQEAVTEHRQAVRLDPRDARLLNNLGRSLIATGVTREAIAVLEHACSLTPDDPVPAVNLAAAWLASGDAGRAEGIARSVLQAHPEREDARRVLDAARSITIPHP